MTPRYVALLRERAALARQLARIDGELADEAEGVAAPPTPELAARRAARDVDRLLARTGR